MKPDKYPYLDPCVRGIFDRIVETAALIRKERKSEEFMQAERWREESLKAVRELRAREVKAAELKRLEEELRSRAPTFVAFKPGQPLLSLRESDLPNLVR